jgi:hypothetical protein
MTKEEYHGEMFSILELYRKECVATREKIILVKEQEKRDKFLVNFSASVLENVEAVPSVIQDIYSKELVEFGYIGNRSIFQKMLAAELVNEDYFTSRDRVLSLLKGKTNKFYALLYQDVIRIDSIKSIFLGKNNLSCWERFYTNIDSVETILITSRFFSKEVISEKTTMVKLVSMIPASYEYADEGDGTRRPFTISKLKHKVTDTLSRRIKLDYVLLCRSRFGFKMKPSFIFKDLGSFETLFGRSKTNQDLVRFPLIPIIGTLMRSMVFKNRMHWKIFFYNCVNIIIYIVIKGRAHVCCMFFDHYFEYVYDDVRWDGESIYLQ